MDEDAIKRIEQKIDYLAGILIGVLGAGVPLAAAIFGGWGDWSGWIGGIAAVVLPAYLVSKYRDILREVGCK